ncbi:uracil-xanthine permease family protein [Nocardia pseudobrasiliensis]|uniref:Xanthine/uracil permease n=1 Tax=Nocardia pseudobrasiliensis TaxID=45979 RepID=A0A370IDP1_9NOCA|nr:solute carrier family 23 protein [Nocardia pseudobrasiliensis]RDI68836.1 xanthine/uracil permease [Nocardia pseudobrasiliensis]
MTGVVETADEKLPAARALVAAVQHLLVMVATPIASVLLIGRSLGLGDGEVRALLCAVLLFGGVGTVLQSLGRGSLGAGLPFVMLPGGAAVVLFVQIAQSSGAATASGAVIITAVAGIVLVPVARRFVTRLPAVVIASMIVVIGVNLVKVAGGLIVAPEERSTVAAVSLAAVTVVVTVLAHRFLPGGWRRLAVLVGMVAGAAVALAVGRFQLHAGGGVVQLPRLFLFGTPHFDLIASVPLLVFGIGSMAEATGQTLLNARIVGRTIDPEATVGRTIRGDAVTSLLSGLFGGPSMVTSGENIGLLRLTGVRSRYVTALTGLLLIVVAFLAPVGRIVNSLPGPVIGGTAAIAFTMIVAAGIGMFERVDLRSDGELITATAALTAGLLPILTPALYRDFPADLRLLLGSGVTMAAVVGTVVHVLFALRWRGLNWRFGIRRNRAPSRASAA